MRLRSYLAQEGISYAEFAARLGEASESGVRKWVRGERLPRADAMRRIQKITKGKVSPADFFAPAPTKEKVA